MFIPLFSGGSSSPLITADAADFDGTNDYMSKTGLSGIAASRKVLLSFWFRIDGGDGTQMLVIEGKSGAAAWRLYRQVTNVFDFIAHLGVFDLLVVATTTNTYTSSATWRHFLLSYNTATSTFSWYIDGTAEAAASLVANVNTFPFDSATWTIGASSDGSLKANICLAEYYFAPDQALDITLQENRELFRSSGGKPDNLGSTGATPTGTIPAQYLHLDDSEAAANFATDRSGNSNTMTITGTLTTASTSPSD